MARVDTYTFANGKFAIEAGAQYEVTAAEYEIHGDLKDNSGRHILKGEKGTLQMVWFNMFGYHARVHVHERDYYVDVPPSCLILSVPSRDNVRTLKPKSIKDTEEQIERLMGTGANTRKIDESKKRLEAAGWVFSIFDYKMPEFTAYVDYGKQTFRSNVPKANLMAFLMQRVEVMAAPEMGIIDAYTYQYVDAELAQNEVETAYHKILTCVPYTGDLPKPPSEEREIPCLSNPD